jgi:primosomal protein N' (replication factor Y)
MTPGAGVAGETSVVASVLPDVSGLDRSFDYVVPEALVADVGVGAVVRVGLRHRRVRGWVVELRDEPVAACGDLRAILALVSLGPPPDVVDLARWAAWRWAGRLRPFLLASSSPRIVRRIVPAGGAPPALQKLAAGPVGPAPTVGASPVQRPAPGPGGPAPASSPAPGGVGEVVRSALDAGAALVRLPPASSRLEVVEAVVAERRGPDGVLVLVPERRDVEVLRRRLIRLGLPVAVLPEDWAQAAAGGRLVVAARAGAMAPLPLLRAAVVLDAHDEAYIDDRAPTWSAPVLLAERARRAGAALLLVSSCPCLDLHGLAKPIDPPRALERAGWAPVEILDRRVEDPRSGRYSPKLAELIRGARRRQPELPVVCVLNRTGRVRLLACGACGELVRCTSCGSAMHEPARGGEAAGELAGPGLVCPVCGAARPRLCAGCGSTRLKRLRVGVAGAAEELASLTGLAVTEVSGREPAGAQPVAGDVLVGTEAVLRRVRRASLAVFLDLDQELLSPRLRAGEQALALLARAARLVGGRGAGGGSGRVVIQTRLPEHEVVRSALHGDPGILERAELERRSRLGLPPFASLALITGLDGDELATRLRAAGLEVGSPPAGRLAAAAHLVRASGPAALADALAASGSASLDVRVEVDPLAA